MRRDIRNLMVLINPTHLFTLGEMGGILKRDIGYSPDNAKIT